MFYELFYTYLKKNSGTKIAEYCQRIIDNLGIFMYKFDRKLKKLEDSTRFII